MIKTKNKNHVLANGRLYAGAIFLIVLLAMSCYGINSKKVAAKKTKLAVTKRFAVIELFTSEGCSSCPAADNLVSKVLNEHKQNVYILSYHVDYWDRLGWKDGFSNSAFSVRQKQYARILNLESIYTPQIIVNGSDEFVGSDERKLRSSISNNGEPASDFSVKSEGIHNSAVKITYSRTNSEPVLLNLALVQPEAFTEVKSGENGGRKLHHVNIVRELKTIETSTDTGSVEIPVLKELTNIPLQLIAFTQQKDNMMITSVRQVSL